jgi:hypothetical protein
MKSFLHHECPVNCTALLAASLLGMLRCASAMNPADRRIRKVLVKAQAPEAVTLTRQDSLPS